MAKAEEKLSTTTVTINSAKRMIANAMRRKRAVFIWGSPGIGKSDAIEQIAREQNRPVVDMRLLLCEPTDLRGIPYFCPTDNIMKWAPPSDLPKADGPMANAILFLDELTAAPQSVQAAAYQLILNRRIGEYVLPADVDIVAAGNKMSDRGVSNRMPTPLANRFIHIDLDVNFEEWSVWATQNNVHRDVVAFLTTQKSKLFAFDAKSGETAFATPRSWKFVSDTLFSQEEHNDLGPTEVAAMVKGTVGEGIGSEFLAFKRFASKLPKPEDVLFANIKKMPTDGDISACYALTVNCAYTLKDMAQLVKNGDSSTNMTVDEWHMCFNNFLAFCLANFQPDMCILAARMCFRDFKLKVDHRKVKAFTEFAEKYSQYLSAA